MSEGNVEEGFDSGMTCAHLGCGCSAGESDPYCSEYCRRSDEMQAEGSEDAELEEYTCQCGHKECGELEE